MFGLSFKAGTDDLRCSPIVEVVESLIGKGYEIGIYDRNVKVSDLTGTNRQFILDKIPHLHHLVSDNLDAVASEADILVITNKEKEFAELPARYPGKIIIDLVRAWDTLDYPGHYEGLSWATINTNPAQTVPVSRDLARTDF